MASSKAKPVILAVDDVAEMIALIVKTLSADYEVKFASNGAAGLALASAKPQPDLVLLDIEMPGMDGFEVCKALKANPATAAIPVVFLTVRGEPRDEMQGFALGAVDYVAKPISPALLKARVRTHVALASRREALEALVRERTAQLEKASHDLIACLGRALEFHESAATGNRSLRVAHYAKLIAQAAGVKPAACALLLMAASLHDIGKLGVPAEILRRAGALSEPDWESVRRHAEYGAAIIGEHQDPLLQLAHAIALTHHERWDGSGYPKGLKGEAIPLPGRIVAIADSFEAMTSTQFHREPLGVEQAAADILRGSGTRYDPQMVKAFRKALPTMRKVRAALPDKLGAILNLDFRAGEAAGGAPAARLARSSGR